MEQTVFRVIAEQEPAGRSIEKRFSMKSRKVDRGAWASALTAAATTANRKVNKREKFMSISRSNNSRP
jgi:hypothetical protein